MSKTVKYAVFKTEFGYFGIAGTENTVHRSCLPLADPEDVERALLKDCPNAVNTPNLQKPLQESITAYFKGIYVDFSDVAVDLDGMTSFSRKVLLSCQKIPLGETYTYSQLAKASENSKAIRAAGSVMAKNPIPLIIPCHRVIRSDGKAGRFSARGGTNLKRRLLRLEAGS
jgi:methylated-DNA-[protein]-cysteine S-methyltransferase